MGRLKVKRGKYGRSKVKAFYVFAQYPKMRQSTRQLCTLTGIKYRSLARHLPRWCGFGYVDRSPLYEWGRGDYEYHMLKRAHKWIELAERDLPNYQLFIDELLEWQVYIKPRLSELLQAGFSEFIVSHDAAIADFSAR